jgi:hypothetical protein
VDLGSRNGTILNGEKIEQKTLDDENDVRLNEVGPILRLEVVAAGEPTRSAMTRFGRCNSVAHIRSVALDLDRTRGSGSFKR